MNDSIGTSAPPMGSNKVPVLGFAAWSGTGKTSVLRKLIPALREDGLRLGVVKHAHHAFDVDQPGKDSYELRHAGASHVLVGSKLRWALMVEREADGENTSGEPTLTELLGHMPAAELDLILVEGFKHEAFPKIELHRKELARPLLYPQDSNIVAIACDCTLDPSPTIPVLDLNNLSVLQQFVRAFAMQSIGQAS
jgi:molybdopterin-guanine dinucleotide biosynthesis protein MobB